MKPSLLSFLLLLLASCSEPLTDTTTTVPFAIGSSINDVHSRYGAPDLDNLNSDYGPSESYFRKGVVVEYNYSRDTVTSIELVDFSQHSSGVRSTEKIHGISMENDLDDCEELWGPYYVHRDLDYMSHYTWYYKGNTIEVEVMNESGVWVGGGSYSSGDLRTVTLTKGMPENVDTSLIVQ